jgi:hypothetical protein
MRLTKPPHRAGCEIVGIAAKIPYEPLATYDSLFEGVLFRFLPDRFGKTERASAA